MEIYPINHPQNLIETDVIESLKTCTGDRAHAVIWHQEVFFPTHKDVFTLSNVFDDNGRASPSLFCMRSECWELGPMRQVCLLVGAPIVVLGNEAVLCTDNFALKERG